MKILSKTVVGSFLKNITVQLEDPKSIEAYKQLVIGYECPHCNAKLAPLNDICKIQIDEPLSSIMLGDVSMDLGTPVCECAMCSKTVMCADRVTFNTEPNPFPEVTAFLNQLRSAAISKFKK